MNMIYLVTGCTGEYEDYSEWVVCAYTTEAKARGRVDQLNSLLSALSADLPNQCQTIEVAMRQHEYGDPCFELSLSGIANYGLKPVELID